MNENLSSLFKAFLETVVIPRVNEYTGANLRLVTAVVEEESECLVYKASFSKNGDDLVYTRFLSYCDQFESICTLESPAYYGIFGRLADYVGKEDTRDE